MKKIFIILVTVLLCSCNQATKTDDNNALYQIEWRQHAIEDLFSEMDSLYNADIDKYGYTHKYYINAIDELQKQIDKLTKD